MAGEVGSLNNSTKLSNLIHRELADGEVQNYFYDLQDQLVKVEIFKKELVKHLAQLKKTTNTSTWKMLRNNMIRNCLWKLFQEIRITK